MLLLWKLFNPLNTHKERKKGGMEGRREAGREERKQGEKKGSEWMDGRMNG